MMKKKSAVLMLGFILLMALAGQLSAQNIPDAKASFIQPYKLGITYSKTTSLIFPYGIKSVDRGSKDILVQKAIGVENILQIKAAKMGFAETNLTVVTADGSLYPFTVSYTDSPASLSLLFTNPQILPKPVAVFAKDATTDVIALKAQEAAARERTVDGIRDNSYDMIMDIKGLYIHNDVLYFQISLRNKSAIDYDIQSLRFYIYDKKKVKRTASQETELQPVYISGNASLIRHSSEQTICVALSKFTIPDKKYLSVQLMESNGGRHLSVKINNKNIIKSRSI